jgi:hypothetical protein
MGSIVCYFDPYFFVLKSIYFGAILIVRLYVSKLVAAILQEDRPQGPRPGGGAPAPGGAAAPAPNVART